MAGAAAAFYLNRSGDERVAIEVHMLLKRICSKVEATSKGKVWDVWIGDRSLEKSRSFFIRLKDTKDFLTECEDEMLDLQIDEQTHPSYLEISAGCNQEEDKVAMSHLLEALVTVGGVAGELEK